jgi:hypothetical protein
MARYRPASGTSTWRRCQFVDSSNYPAEFGTGTGPGRIITVGGKFSRRCSISANNALDAHHSSMALTVPLRLSNSVAPSPDPSSKINCSSSRARNLAAARRVNLSGPAPQQPPRTSGGAIKPLQRLSDGDAHKQCGSAGAPLDIRCAR